MQEKVKWDTIAMGVRRTRYKSGTITLDMYGTVAPQGVSVKIGDDLMMVHSIKEARAVIDRMENYET